MENPFYILNVTPKSSFEDIKRSYKNLIKIYHPDIYPGDKEAATEKMKELNWAFEVLSDAYKRKEYEEKYYEQQKNFQKDNNENSSAEKTKSNKINFQTILIVTTIIFVILSVILIYRYFNPNTNKSKTNINYSSEIIYDTEDSIVVYITVSGKKYHKASCSHLSHSKIELTLEDALIMDYEPCSQCKPQKAK